MSKTFTVESSLGEVSKANLEDAKRLVEEHFQAGNTAKVTQRFDNLLIPLVTHTFDPKTGSWSKSQ